MDMRAKTCCFTGHRSLNGVEKLKVAVWKDSMFSLLFVRCCPIYKNAPTFAY